MRAMCDMCLETKDAKHFDLYISGSEGTKLCHGCQMLVVKFIQEQARAALRRREAEHIVAREGI
jgi:hypothetical protein